ncbi:MAG: fatty acid desaturase [Nocardioidaceae bacterium]|nr:fatty acid desaturase [Nocardioidaceae bacterium]
MSSITPHGATATSPSTAGGSSSRIELRQPVAGLPDPGERVPRLAWPTAALYVASLGLFAVEMVGLLALNWTPWVTVPMGTAVAFLMFSVLHEATHHAISTNTRLNNTFGHLSTPFVVAWAGFPLFRFIHIEHHRNTNENKTVDPDAWTSEGPWWQLPLRWATTDLWYVVFYLRRIRERPRTEVANSIMIFVAGVGALTALAATGHGQAVLWGYLVPQRLGLMVLAWWFDYLPHHGLTMTQREDKYQATRVRVGGEKVLTPLFVYQNYHLVHHLHPSVPFYRYVRAWRRNEQAYLDRNAAISTWFGRSLTPNEYRTWRRLTDELAGPRTSGSGQRLVFHPLRVRAIEPLTADAVTVTFDVPADLAHEYRYSQGQHITLRAVIDGEEHRRSYSVVESVSSRTLRIAVKKGEDGVFSGYVTKDLAVDDILDVMTPTGAFHVQLDADQARHHVAVVAGSGITPMMSTIATTLEVEPRSRFTLIYGNRTSASTMFTSELAALGERYGDRLVVQHVLSGEEGAVLAGRVTPELVLGLVEDAPAVHAWFLCGPHQMVEEMQTALGQVTDSARVLTEIFHVDNTNLTSLVTVDLASEVIISLDGVETTLEISSSGEPILDAALQAGIDPPYSCAGGACGTCKAKVLLGKAVMDQNHVLDDDEVADGYVLTCQAHPVSEEVRIDYDA